MPIVVAKSRNYAKVVVQKPKLEMEETNGINFGGRAVVTGAEIELGYDVLCGDKGYIKVSEGLCKNSKEEKDPFLSVMEA
jgi:hypothetical protein